QPSVLRRVRVGGVGAEVALRGDVARAEEELRGVYREAGVHAELVVARDIADEHVFPRCEIERHGRGFSSGDACDLSDLAVLLRLRRSTVGRKLVRREVGLYHLKAVLHGAEVANADLDR